MIFNNEYKYLIHLLSCALNNEQPEDIPENLSLEKVFEYGKIHEVANIAFLAVKRLKTPPSPELLKEWNEYYWKAIQRDTVQKNTRAEVIDALHSNGIYTLEVQGTVVKKYYPQSHLRMMTDIDIIVPGDKLKELPQIMREIGYTSEFLHNNTEIHSKKNQMLIEFHSEFFDSEQNVYNALNNPFARTTLNGDYIASLSDTDFYLFHLLHTLKHATEWHGIGIRRIVDLFYLEKVMPEKADYNYIDEVLKANGLYEIKVKLLALKDMWFNSTEPEADLSELEAEILQAGNHGKEDIYYKHKFIKEQSDGKRFVKFKYLLSFLFPNKSLVYAAHPFCEKHHFPAVLCWLFRFAFLFNPKKLKAFKRVYTNLGFKTEESEK